ncbi:MAG: hypothetical protein KJ645_01740, partial [Planctomycetes bacterium]|nr:hypothetical protein [Planctomycetota bacterium]
NGIPSGELTFPGAYPEPPFEFELNSADADPETGSLDISTVTEDFLPLADFMADPDNNFKQHIRFKIKVLTEKVVGLDTFTNPRIDKVVFSISD